jgi:carbamate kinase
VRLVVALGGNALLRRGEPLEAAVKQRNIAVATRALAELARDHLVVVTHGNGPQVGLLALQGAAYTGVTPYPLDVLGAESEGMIGYLLETELRAALPGREVATLLTQVIVDADDPAFHQPTKPIGPVYAEAEARLLADQRGWTGGPDGPHWRRLVASPEPRRIVELTAIRILVGAGAAVVCAGGGGVPGIQDGYGALRGVEAVIDKDLAAALLARALPLHGLLMLTDVDAVYTNWGEPEARPIRAVTPPELRAMVFALGSMGPKVEAACRFVEAGGRFAVIGALADAGAILRRERGTWIANA